MNIDFPGTVSIIFDEWLPEPAQPIGYAALIAACNLRVPIPATRSAISSKHRSYEADGWRIHTPRQAPEASLLGHLTFAFRYEGLDLLVLKRLFERTGPHPIEELVRAHSASTYARRTWFLYEWLVGERLNLPDAKTGRYDDVLDTSLQFGITSKSSPRHRLKDNLPGTSAFCPLIRKSVALDQYLSSDLSTRAKSIVNALSPDLMRRAAAFLLLEDTKSTFEIEGERPNYARLQQWGRAIGQAGRHPISVQELERLQRIVLEDNSTVKLGLRQEEGFIGQHDRMTHDPIPSHVSARQIDVLSLVDGMIRFDDKAGAGGMDPVLAAAALAFGFVFIHPFADGNGRIHRYLIHHMLAKTGYTPQGVVFPVSAVMERESGAYREALEAYSRHVLRFVDWRPAANGNVEVLNDTADLYRYFDATPQAEFLYHCVRHTIELDLPEEIRSLRVHDAFKEAIKRRMDLPERLEELAFSFLFKGEGRFSKRARTKELVELGERLDDLERLYAEAVEYVNDTQVEPEPWP